MEKKLSPKKYKDFMFCLTKLEPVEFIGLAKLLNVEIIEQKEPQHNENGKVTVNLTPRDFSEILEDILDAYGTCNRKRRREFDKLLKQMAKGYTPRNTLVAARPMEESEDVRSED